MNFIKWANSRVKRMGFAELSLVKLSVFAFALMIAKIWEPLLVLDWYWYALIFILAAIIPLYKALKK